MKVRCCKRMIVTALLPCYMSENSQRGRILSSTGFVSICGHYPILGLLFDSRTRKVHNLLLQLLSMLLWCSSRLCDSASFDVLSPLT